MKYDLTLLDYEELEHIDIIWTRVCECVKNTIEEHYNNEKYKNTLFIVGNPPTLDTHTSANVPGICMKNITGQWDTIIDYRYLHNKYDRVIYYFLEHSYYLDQFLGEGTYLKNLDILNYLDCIDEIWVPWIELFSHPIIKSNINKVKFKPMRYNTKWEEYRLDSKEEYENDLIFFGSISDGRHKYIGNLTSGGWNDFMMIDDKTEYVPHYQLEVIMIAGKLIIKSLNLIGNTKYNLDILRSPDIETEQNVVRIFEMILLNKPTVCIYKDIFNYFDGLVKQFYFNNLDDKIFFQTYIRDAIPIKNISELFKKLTYEDEDYDRYIEGLIKKFKDFNSYNEGFKKSCLESLY